MNVLPYLYRSCIPEAFSQPGKVPRTSGTPDSKAGFTLIEMLVVVAIMALLLSLMVPGIGKMQDRAATVACMNNLRQIGTALLMNAGDNQGRLPYDTTLTNWNTTGHGYALVPEESTLRNYLGKMDVYVVPHEYKKGKRILECPVYTFKEDGFEHKPVASWNFKPSTIYWSIRTYRLNDWLFELDPATSPNGWTDGKLKLSPLTGQISNPGKLILAGEGYDKGLFNDYRAMYFNPRHGNKSPAVRADGSVSLYSYEDATRLYAGGLWFPNAAIRPNEPEATREAVETWGTYLHPSFNMDLYLDAISN
jgi:prepilin-type N-terminal cleavage/methylation domain-containing protein